MELAGSQEGIDRVGEYNQVGLGNSVQDRGEVLFQMFDFLGSVDDAKGMLWELDLQIADGLQGNAVLAFGASVDNEDLPANSPLFFYNGHTLGRRHLDLLFIGDGRDTVLGAIAAEDGMTTAVKDIFFGI